MSEEKQGQDFYDQAKVFERYTQHRQGANNPHELIEKPIIRQLVSGIKGDVLDLGCVYGDLAEELFGLVATTYTGIDSSVKMIEMGQSLINDPRIKLEKASLQSWDYGIAQYDWAIARLVFQYIEDLASVLAPLSVGLRPNAQLLFSVEHPVLTSSMHLPRPKGKKQDWTLDQYFQEGPRHQAWMESKVIKYHRNIETYWRLLQDVGFRIAEIQEGRPDLANFSDSSEYERRCRIPLFLIIKAGKI